VFVFGVAQARGAEVLLRIDDHDRTRCHEEYVTAIIEDLAWLGFRWDAVTRQSDHFERYAAVLERLRTMGLVRQEHGQRIRVGDDEYAAVNRDGDWTYPFCVVVDDMEEGIDLVVRGEDILEATPRQIALAELLGRKIKPEFIHHPLVLGADGQKLSKRQKAACIRAEREAGILPAQLLGEVCHAAGLIPQYRPLQAEELGALFG
jgi:glutamyl/glutaminyl-tRNA synthetase